MFEQPFRDRTEAGSLLGAELKRRFGQRADALVLALPRGGVPIGFEVAEALNAPLDVFIVRKLGVPGQEELAMGAIASGGVRVLNNDVIRYASIPAHVIDRVAAAEQQELERREKSYRGIRPPLNVAGKTVFVIDDGLATGSTMRAAVQALRNMSAREVIVAVPVAARESCNEFRALADDVICLRTPSPFQAVGLWYDDFSQTSDEEVHELLDRASKPMEVSP
jgi:predicted phosphoribosyltransferase